MPFTWGPQARVWKPPQHRQQRAWSRPARRSPGRARLPELDSAKVPFNSSSERSVEALGGGARGPEDGGGGWKVLSAPPPETEAAPVSLPQLQGSGKLEQPQSLQPESRADKLLLCGAATEPKGAGLTEKAGETQCLTQYKPHTLSSSSTLLRVLVIVHRFSPLLVVMKRATRNISSQPKVRTAPGPMASETVRTQDGVTTLACTES